ncbi:MAG: hypothetical protein NZ750_04300 [Anaerolineae bacterium]|nr:hypothetical protein [Anaerolineae bacterium]MDW8171266.1 hypothetical protein [Anaerolineae bacterium]
MSLGRRLARLLASTAVLSLGLSLALAQDQARPLVALSVSAGYDGYFRETPAGSWTPVRVRVENRGGPLDAMLVIRPQTTGRVVANATRQAVRLPASSAQDYTLWIMPRRFPPQVTVELLAEDESRLAQASASLTSVPPERPLYLVLTAADDRAPNLSQVVPSGGAERAAQAQWRAAQPPGRADLSAFTAIIALEQPAADWEAPLRAYVAQGGHLILAGQALALADSPLKIDGARTLDDLRSTSQALQAFTQAEALSTDGRVSIARASLAKGARALLRLDDGAPLIARRDLGAGTLDALAFDPRQQPWVAWNGLSRLWWTLLASAPAAPSWQVGFNDPASAAQALAVLPDLELLPPITTLAAFLGAYVLLIAPLNYLLLARLRRLEWAWLTIPLAIVGFTALAWTVGFNLRGDQTVLSRLAFIYAWGEDGQQAQAWGLAGILSPRRAVLDVSAAPQVRLSSFAGLNQSAATYQSSATLWTEAQGDSVRGLALDGGIFANVQQSVRLPDPRIRLELRVLPAEVNAFGVEQHPARVQGLILNNGSLILEDGLLLVGQTAYALNVPLLPNDSLALLGDELAWRDPPYAWPSRLEVQPDVLPSLGLSARFGVALSPPQRSASADLIARVYELAQPEADPAQARRLARRVAWLRAFLRDQYSALHPAHLATFIAWANELPSELALSGRQWRTQEEALFVVQAPLRFDQRTVIAPWEFTWAMLERGGAVGGVDRLTLDAEQVAIIRFIPRQPLSQPLSLRLSAERGGGYGRSVQLALRDWTTGDFLTFSDASRDVYVVDQDVARYVGPNGALDVRLTMANLAGSARVQNIAVQVEGLP